MEVTALLIFWGGALAMLWMLKTGSSFVESSFKKTKRVNRPRKIHMLPSYRAPDAVGNIIGQYMNEPIYCRITVEDKDYYFSRIEPLIDPTVKANELILEPGIVYSIIALEAA